MNETQQCPFRATLHCHLVPLEPCRFGSCTSRHLLTETKGPVGSATALDHSWAVAEGPHQRLQHVLPVQPLQMSSFPLLYMQTTLCIPC